MILDEKSFEKEYAAYTIVFEGVNPTIVLES